MAIEVANVPRPAWSPLPYDGCRGVDGKVLLARGDLSIAMLRFEEEATIHEHPAARDTDVFCLEGRGKTSVGGEQAEIQAGQRVRWPANENHRLWTEGEEMLTLMIEHPAAGAAQARS